MISRPVIRPIAGGFLAEAAGWYVTPSVMSDDFGVQSLHFSLVGVRYFG